MKSPAIEEALRPIKMLAPAAREEFSLAKARFDARAVAARVRTKHAEREAGRALAKDKNAAIDDLLKVPAVEEPPKLKRFIATNASVEALHELHQENPNGLLVLVNPEFVERDGMQLEEEGCLSVPGFNATVVRPSHAVLKGLDRHGDPQQIEGSGLLARAFQHEMDHLDGTLFVDRLRGLKRDIIVRKIRKLTRAGKW
jgi:peptide deformylase